MTEQYSATAVREGRWWVVEVDGIGTTQGRNLAEAEEMARDLVSVMHDVPIDNVAVTLVPVVEGVDVAGARQAVADAAAAQADAAAQSRHVAAELRNRGLTGADTARVLGVSPQRVSQLLSRGRGRG